MSILDKVTQGPWEPRKPKHPDIRQIEDRLVVAKIDGEFHHVAEIYQYRNNNNREADGTALANAALVSGAFELARAAQDVVECWESGDLAAAVRELDNVLRQIEAEA